MVFKASRCHTSVSMQKQKAKQARQRKNAKNVAPRIDNDDESGHMSHICFFEPEISWWEI